MNSPFEQGRGARRGGYRGALAIAGALALAVAYKLELQPRLRSWGTTIVERTRTLPGDELVPRAGIEITHATTVAAPLDAVWGRLQEIEAGLPEQARDSAAVSVLAPGQAIALEGWGVFLVEPAGPDASRLIARARIPAGLPSLLYALAFELPHFLTRRRLLLWVKGRTEATTLAP